VARFEDDPEQRKALKKAWHHVVTHSAHAKELLNKDLNEKGDLTVRPANHDASYAFTFGSVSCIPQQPMNQ
jgi:hypothetical protein